MSDYERIAKAIDYIGENVTAQPSLADVASHVHLSPFHFQRLFSRWAGTTPKRFLQVLTLERGKRLLKESASLLEVADELGLSSSSRLHDHFVQLEAVTPGEYRNKGKGLSIRHGVHDTPFGRLFIARTPRGVCRAAFVDDGDGAAQLDRLARGLAARGARAGCGRDCGHCRARVGARAGSAAPPVSACRGHQFSDCGVAGPAAYSAR